MQGWLARQGQVLWRGLVRVPFAAAITTLLLISGFASAGFWQRVDERGWYESIAYGVPAMREGHWWSLVSGMPFGLHPAVFVLLVVLAPIVLGWTEIRLGTARTALVFLAGQVLSVAGATGLLLLADQTDWRWANEQATVWDVGLTTGLVAVLAVLTATFRSPWRLRARVLLSAYVAVSFLFLGRFADVTHILAVLVFLPVGNRWLSGVERGYRPRTRRETRLLAFVGLLVIAAVEVLVYFVPSDGPFGPTEADSSSLWSMLLSVAIVAAVADQLRRGRRWAWWVTVVYAALLVGMTIVVLAFVVITDYESIGLVSVGVGLLWGIELFLLVIGRAAFHVPARGRAIGDTGSAAPVDRARESLAELGGGTMSWMITWPGNDYLFAGDGVIGFQRHAGVLLELTDPVCAPGEVGEAVARFEEVAEGNGAIPCLFSVSGATADAARARGWRCLQIAEDAVLDLPELEFRGKKWQNVRSALNKAERGGMEFAMVTLREQSAAVLSQVREISEQWVGEKDLPEMGFTLGTVEEALDPQVRVALATDSAGQVQGVLSWLPVFAPGGGHRGWTLDVMRKRDGEGANNVMEFLIARSAQLFKEEGAEFLSLSGAPLARADADGDVTGMDRALDLLGSAIEPFYGFRSLHQFKSKFNPRYEPVYLCCRDEADLPRIAIAIGRAYLPTATPRQLLAMARQG